MSRPRILTEEQRLELAKVAQLRKQTPSNKQLARQWNCSVSTIKLHIHLAMRPVSRETIGGHDAQ